MRLDICCHHWLCTLLVPRPLWLLLIMIFFSFLSPFLSFSFVHPSIFSVCGLPFLPLPLSLNFLYLFLCCFPLPVSFSPFLSLSCSFSLLLFLSLAFFLSLSLC